jgi:Na+/H+ antiporter NhaD/arsenite permease-like protein
MSGTRASRVGLQGAAVCLLLLAPSPARAEGLVLDLTRHWSGYLVCALFVIAYGLVIVEEFTRLRKAKPVLLAAGFTWLLIGLEAVQRGQSELAAAAVRATLGEYAELLLFLLVAMTYVNAMSERNVFGALSARLSRSGATYRRLFWTTGVLSFFMSAVLDNLTTALVMGAIVVELADDERFVPLACINIVVCANAGGVWSAFGDITSLMVWQADLLLFTDFFHLFLPAVATALIPSLAMHFALPPGAPPPPPEAGDAKIAPGGLVVIFLFLVTLVTALLFQQVLRMPPAIGMMLGLAYLQFFGYALKMRRVLHTYDYRRGQMGDVTPVDVFRYTARAEWDTLLFFYGVILCVSGLGAAGYLELVSHAVYAGAGPTAANLAVGVASALVDNIPIMAAVIGMQPEMSHGQWLLVTLSAGVGGSLLSAGSAAGVALMGQARGHYTFFQHLRWAPVIALGCAAGVVVHLTVNARFF